MSPEAPVLELRGITKRFPGTVANDGIDLDLRRGEILALLGENGAGKTTLMNIVYGLVTPDAGEIRIDDQPVVIRDPADAIARGIGMVHQHFMLVPVLTVAENVILGQEIMRSVVIDEIRLPLPFLDLREAGRRIRDLGSQLGFDIRPDARVDSLTVGQQQRVEILKAIYRRARILVLDEPTAVLTPQESEEVFGVLKKLARDGVSIIFISHKLDEVMAIADRITVIRRGRVVGTKRPAETNENDLATMMVGREVLLRVDRGTSNVGDVVLRIEALHARDDRRHDTVRGADLEVRRGEILGIAGVAGNGQDELVEALVGLRRATGGRVLINGREVTHASVRAVREHAVAYVPADRQRFGLVLSYPIQDNLVLTSYYRPPFAAGIVRNDNAVQDFARRLIAKFDIRTPSEKTRAAALSGGNQQKIVVAREFRDDLDLLILDQPTRGLDIGSIEFIHRQVIAKRDSGVGVLLISADLDEVLELSDRIAVMYRGRLVATFDAAEAQREKIGLLMAVGEAR